MADRLAAYFGLELKQTRRPRRGLDERVCDGEQST
jgi:hypothetical protein